MVENKSLSDLMKKADEVFESSRDHKDPSDKFREDALSGGAVTRAEAEKKAVPGSLVSIDGGVGVGAGKGVVKGVTTLVSDTCNLFFNHDTDAVLDAARRGDRTQLRTSFVTSPTKTGSELSGALGTVITNPGDTFSKLSTQIQGDYNTGSSGKQGEMVGEGIAFALTLGIGTSELRGLTRWGKMEEAAAGTRLIGEGAALAREGRIIQEAGALGRLGAETRVLQEGGTLAERLTFLSKGTGAERLGAGMKLGETVEGLRTVDLSTDAAKVVRLETTVEGLAKGAGVAREVGAAERISGFSRLTQVQEGNLFSRLTKAEQTLAEMEGAHRAIGGQVKLARELTVAREGTAVAREAQLLAKETKAVEDAMAAVRTAQSDAAVQVAMRELRMSVETFNKAVEGNALTASRAAELKISETAVVKFETAAGRASELMASTRVEGTASKLYVADRATVEMESRAQQMTARLDDVKAASSAVKVEGGVALETRAAGVEQSMQKVKTAEIAVAREQAITELRTNVQEFNKAVETSPVTASRAAELKISEAAVTRLEIAARESTTIGGSEKLEGTAATLVANETPRTERRGNEQPLAKQPEETRIAGPAAAPSWNQRGADPGAEVANTTTISGNAGTAEPQGADGTPPVLKPTGRTGPTTDVTAGAISALTPTVGAVSASSIAPFKPVAQTDPVAGPAESKARDGNPIESTGSAIKTADGAIPSLSLTEPTSPKYTRNDQAPAVFMPAAGSNLPLTPAQEIEATERTAPSSQPEPQLPKSTIDERLFEDEPSVVAPEPQMKGPGTPSVPIPGPPTTAVPSHALVQRYRNQANETALTLSLDARPLPAAKANLELPRQAGVPKAPENLRSVYAGAEIPAAQKSEQSPTSVRYPVASSPLALRSSQPATSALLMHDGGVRAVSASELGVPRSIWTTKEKTEKGEPGGDWAQLLVEPTFVNSTAKESPAPTGSDLLYTKRSSVLLPELEVDARGEFVDRLPDEPLPLRASRDEEKRRRYVIRKNDTLASIALNKLGNANLAALIFEINEHVIPYTYGSRRILISLRPGLVIYLPTSKEVKEFRSRPFSVFTPEFSYTSLFGSPQEELAAIFGSHWSDTIFGTTAESKQSDFLQFVETSASRTHVIPTEKGKSGAEWQRLITPAFALQYGASRLDPAETTMLSSTQSAVGPVTGGPQLLTQNITNRYPFLMRNGDHGLLPSRQRALSLGGRPTVFNAGPRPTRISSMAADEPRNPPSRRER